MAAGAGTMIDVLESEPLIGDAFGAALRRCHEAGQAPGSAPPR